MNDYIRVKFTVTPCSETATDVLAALLGETGYESFVADENGSEAFIPYSLYKEETLREVIGTFPLDVRIGYRTEFIPGRDWNEEWEKKYFTPIRINDECVIRSPFHSAVPEVRYEVLIDPKMAFGTGHHETTALMISEILKTDLQGKNILDMGCGTAVLAILAVMKGASEATAIDIDEFACENARKNIRLNRALNIRVLRGGAEILGPEMYDIVFANINRNILLADLNRYATSMRREGKLYMSGFYKKDIPVVREEAEQCGFVFCNYAEKNEWVAVKFEKK